MKIDLDAAYTILVEECGARERERSPFLRMTDRFKRLEFCLATDRGYWLKGWLSTTPQELLITFCYSPMDGTIDEAPERLAMIERANARLAELVTP